MFDDNANPKNKNMTDETLVVIAQNFQRFMKENFKRNVGQRASYDTIDLAHPNIVAELKLFLAHP